MVSEAAAMPRKHSPELRAEAIALARVMGAEAAGKQLGIDHRRIVVWAQETGQPLGLELPASTWEILRDLAVTKTTSLIASGKANAVTVATIAGIAQRNVD